MDKFVNYLKTEMKDLPKTTPDIERRFQLAEKAGNIGTYEWDLITGQLDFSSQVEVIFGFKPGEWKGNYEQAAALVHPEDRERILKENQEAIDQRKSLNIEHRFIKPDQSIGWVNSKAELILDEKGTPVKMVGVLMDITDRKEAEIALRQSEEHFKAIFHQASMGIAETDLQGKFILVNDRYCEIVGRSREELYQTTLLDITHPEDLQQNSFLLRDAISKGISFSLEKRYIRPDGSYVWVSINVSSVKDAEGKPLYIIGVCHDITERKVYEQSLRESEERFRNLADTAPIFMAMADENGNAVYFNKPWLEWTGRTMEEMQGLGWLVTLHPEDSPKFEHDFKHAFAHQIPINRQYRFRRADGEYRWMLAVGAPRFTPDGKFVGYFGTYTDFHELKEAEQRLEQNNLELQRINNDLDNFIYTASHDLKAPISNLEGLLSALTETDITEEQKPFVERMFASVNRLSHTIRDLTEITHVTKSGKEEEDLISFETITGDVRESIRDMIEKKGATIHTDFQESHIRYSKKNLRSIIYNLVSNAIKYASYERKPEVHIKTARENDRVVLTVSDNGLGISELNKEKIFEMFKRLHDHVEGSGIGLYIVKRIIENAGGKIEVESEPGKGTTFRVLFKG